MAKKITRRLACLCISAGLTSAAFALPAQAKDMSPETFMRGLASDAIVIFKDENLNQTARTEAFRKLLRRGFDLPAVSKFVLGRYWRKASAAERAEFTQLFEDYVVGIYGRRLGHYGGEVLTVTGQRSDGKKGAIVQSHIAAASGPEIKLEWRLKLRDDGWRVVDIMVEGVSLALAQRSEFASVIRNSGGRVAGLVDKLRKKTQTLALNNDSSEPTNVAVSTQ